MFAQCATEKFRKYEEYTRNEYSKGFCLSVNSIFRVIEFMPQSRFQMRQ